MEKILQIPTHIPRDKIQDIMPLNYNQLQDNLHLN